MYVCLCIGLLIEFDIVYNRNYVDVNYIVMCLVVFLFFMYVGCYYEVLMFDNYWNLDIVFIIVDMKIDVFIYCVFLWGCYFIRWKIL